MKKQMFWMCTMCDRYQQHVKPGIPYEGCGIEHCYSPIAGGWFGAYQGILRPPGSDHAHRWCFFCGQEATSAVRVAHHFLGICPVHLVHLRTRVRREGGTVTEVYQAESKDCVACDDRELRVHLA